jgi:hypothetical protein
MGVGRSIGPVILTGALELHAPAVFPPGKNNVKNYTGGRVGTKDDLGIYIYAMHSRCVRDTVN